MLTVFLTCLPKGCKVNISSFKGETDWDVLHLWLCKLAICFFVSFAILFNPYVLLWHSVRLPRSRIPGCSIKADAYLQSHWLSINGTQHISETYPHQYYSKEATQTDLPKCPSLRAESVCESSPRQKAASKWPRSGETRDATIKIIIVQVMWVTWLPLKGSMMRIV